MMKVKGLALMVAVAVQAAVRAEEVSADLVIYGSSPAAVTAAIRAKKMGLTPVIVAPTKHIGGLSVSGLGFTDSGNTAAIGGLARDFYRRIYKAYQRPGAWRWQKPEDFKASGQDTKAINHDEKTMWTFEPHIAEKVFKDWMSENDISVRREEFLDRTAGVVKKDGRIVAIKTLSGNTYSGKYFIDATYEGDLLAAAGVPYRVGREDCAEFGEHWNGNQIGVLHHKHHFRNWKISPYKVPGDPSSGLCAEVDPAPPGVKGAGDKRVQAYCYRLCLTDDPRNRLPFTKPENYDPARYELLARAYAKGYKETFQKFDRIANHKTDTNNHGPLNFDWLGGSYEWPEASYERRAELAKAHKDYQMGLLYFLSNDPSVPADVREAMAKWGLTKDEFVDNGGWSYEIYVREGRRMIGAYTMTEHDCLDEARHPAQGKAYGPIGMGSYSLDSHNVRRYVTAEGYVQNEGDIEVRPKTPYGVDYGAIVPRKGDCENLLVPVALSATHTAFGSIRMEPVFMLLGESAATAAALAAKDGRAVQDVAYPELEKVLRANNQVIDLPVDAVNAFVGTAGSGHTTPAACRPFALVQAGPDTGILDWKYCSGYQYGDTSLLGFSSSHISGSGCADLGDVLLLPFTQGREVPLRAAMDKSTEVATPGYYSVSLPEEKVKAEMTATQRTGYFRFTYPTDREAKLLVDLQHGVVVFGENGLTNRVLACNAKVLPDLSGVDAALQVKSWTTRRSFEVIRFSRPAASVTELPKRNPCEKAPRYVFTFAPGEEPLEVKVALSTTSVEGAQKNLKAELPGWNFAAVRQDARAEWNRLLSRMKMTGDKRQRELFYTSLYHTAVGPHDITDVDGAYRGADDKVRFGIHYGEMSLWDTYRASHPFYTLAFPERVEGFVESMVAQSQQQGYLPIWPLRGQETDCMIGNPAVSVIADAYLKGFRGFEIETAWAEIVQSLENPRPNSRVDFANTLGYFPYDQVKVESVSMTLEDAINCDAAAKLAAACGKTREAAHYAKRAKNYRNVFDPSTGFLRGRASDGSWRTPFDPLRICNAYALGGDYTEGNAWQYLWLVPHDVEGLIDLLGGREKFLAKLDELFALPSEPEGQPKLLDVTGLIGQYAHGNEPSQHIAFLYALAGRPARTQELVREICDTFYSLEPDGVCGNEDNGQMSAWYLFAAMGFYPVDPAKGEYVLGAPQVPRVELPVRGPDGKMNLLVTVAKGLSEKNKYVKSVTWNGKRVTGATIRHADLAAGGELVFEMAPAPDCAPVARLRPRAASDVTASNWTIGCEVLDRELAIFREYQDFLVPLGIKRIRLQGGWARCEKEKGVYDFSWLDEPVDFCRAHGIEVLLETSYGNPIYEGAGGWDLGAGFPKSEEGLAAWDRWVEAMAKHFKGRVTDWAMWNEPDLKGRDAVRKTPEEIAAFNVRTAKIIKRIIPEARIAGLSLAQNNAAFLEKCLKAMGDDISLFSTFIYHGYSANPDSAYKAVGEQKAVVRRYAPHARLQQGENGAPSSLCTAYALRDIPWNELSQAKWDLRRMLGDLGHDVNSSLFTIINYTQANRPLNTKGILHTDASRRFLDVKIAYCAVRNLAAVFDETVVRDPAAQARLSVPRGATFVYRSPKGRIVTYWDASGRPDETLHPGVGDLTLDGPAFKDPVLVDLLTGDVFAVPADDIGDDGTYRNLPVHDYPWLLAEKAALPLGPSRAAPHPRLLANAEDFARIRGLSGDLATATKRKVVEIAEAALAKEPVVYKKEGRRLLAVSREALRRICAWSMAWRLTDDRRFAERAVKEALAVSMFQDWNPSHFLDTAEMCLAVAIAYDWCYDVMDDHERMVLEQAMLEKALVQPDGRLIDGWFTHAENNWGQVCQAGLCAGAIALSDVEPLVSDRVIARAVGCLPRCMAAYADGGFPEGPAAYWFYAMEFTAVVMHELEKAYGTDFGLGATPGLDKQADFIDQLTGPTGQTFNFADGGRHRASFEGVGRGTSIAEWFLADKYGTPEVLLRHERNLLAKAVFRKGGASFGRLFPLMLLWMPDEAKLNAQVPPMTSTRVGGRVPVGVLRCGGPAADARFATLKGGKGSDHHGHLDVGSFVYEAKGIRWVIDLGAESYNAIEQTGINLWNMADSSPRWDIFRLGTSAHNVFSLDGKNARASGYADVTVSGRTATADLTACYPGAKKAVRTMTLTEKGLTITDTLEGLKPGTVVDWHFLTEAEATVAEAGALKLSQGGRTQVVRAHEARWQVVSVAEPRHPYESRNDGVVRASFQVKAPADGKVTLTVAFEG